MSIRRTRIRNFEPETLEIYQAFKKQAGSEHIIQPLTIQVLLEICKNQKPKRVLEMGGGIGTVSRLILTHSGAFVDIYEENEFCQNKLRENLAEFAGRYQIVDTYRLMPPASEYDLMIVDGGSGKPADGGYPLAVWFFIHYLKRINTVFIDRYRRNQKLLARKALRKNYIYRLTRYAEPPFKEQSQEFMGGQKLECRPSHSRVLKWLNYLFWETVEGFKYYFDYRFKNLNRW